MGNRGTDLLLGVGMCLSMKVIGGESTFFTMLGIAAGVIGIIGVSVNYAIYKKLLETSKEKYSADIIALADQNRDIAFKVQIKRYVRPVSFESGRIDVTLTEDAPKMLLNEMTSKLRAWTGRSWLVSLSKPMAIIITLR